MTDSTIDFTPNQLTLMGRVTAVAGQVAQAITPDSPALDYVFTMAGQLQLDGLTVMKSDTDKQHNYGALMVSGQLVVMIFHDEALVRPHYYITQDFLHAACCKQPGLIINFAHDGGLQVEFCRYDRESRVMTIGD